MSNATALLVESVQLRGREKDESNKGTSKHSERDLRSVHNGSNSHLTSFVWTFCCSDPKVEGTRNLKEIIPTHHLFFFLFLFWKEALLAQMIICLTEHSWNHYLLNPVC